MVLTVIQWHLLVQTLLLLTGLPQYYGHPYHDSESDVPLDDTATDPDTNRCTCNHGTDGCPTPNILLIKHYECPCDNAYGGGCGNNTKVKKCHGYRWCVVERKIGSTWCTVGPVSAESPACPCTSGSNGCGDVVVNNCDDQWCVHTLKRGEQSGVVEPIVHPSVIGYIVNPPRCPCGNCANGAVCWSNIPQPRRRKDP